MIKFTVKFSPEYEVERVREALGRSQWYKDNGYAVKLPESLAVSSGVNISEDQIRDSVNAEYNEDDFKIQEAYLLENWNKVVDESEKGVRYPFLLFLIY